MLTLKGKKKTYILLVSRGKTNYFTYVLMKHVTENNCEIDALKYL